VISDPKTSSFILDYNADGIQDFLEFLCAVQHQPGSPADCGIETRTFFFCSTDCKSLTKQHSVFVCWFESRSASLFWGVLGKRRERSASGLLFSQSERLQRGGTKGLVPKRSYRRGEYNQSGKYPHFSCTTQLRCLSGGLEQVKLTGNARRSWRQPAACVGRTPQTRHWSGVIVP
jgi:hypothetical protein